MLDAAGTEHEVTSGVTRIVCVVPSITELLFELGLGDMVVGRTGFCFYPKDVVKRVPKVGGTKDFDLDKLRSLRPTHLIVNVDENPKELVDSARSFIPNIVVTHPLGPKDNVSLYQLMGHLFRATEHAERLTELFSASYHSAIDQTSKLNRERVLYLIWKKPWMTIGLDTYIARVLASVGYDHIELDTSIRYPEVNIERLASKVDHILLSTEPFAFRKKDVQELQAAVCLFGKPKVSLIDAEMTSWYGSRAIKGYDYLAAFRAA
ncbi:MAG: helical backbone metal receptor [Proteobacteria bacterium]|nr:helical backbone metal receptor [Pseudomonadota bacterium]